MRLSLLDLFIGMTAVLLGILAVEGVGHIGFARVTPRPTGIVLGIAAGVTIYLTTTPMIYQRLRMRPLWYPLCPTCRDKNRLWQFESAKPKWPREKVRCSCCGTELELWYGAKTADPYSSGTPTFILVWPQSFGRWQRLDPEMTLQDVEPRHSG